MELSRSITNGLGVAAFMLGSPVTYLLAVVETWQGNNAAVWLKLLITLSLDIFLAAIWPITWTIWIAMHAIGRETPITSVLGF